MRRGSLFACRFPQLCNAFVCLRGAAKEPELQLVELDKVKEATPRVEAARAAYEAGDVEASKIVHDTLLSVESAKEAHGK